MLFETRGYDPKMRPTLNFTAQTNITLNFGILYIQNLVTFYKRYSQN